MNSIKNTKKDIKHDDDEEDNSEKQEKDFEKILSSFIDNYDKDSLSIFNYDENSIESFVNNTDFTDFTQKTNDTNDTDSFKNQINIKNENCNYEDVLMDSFDEMDCDFFELLDIENFSKNIQLNENENNLPTTNTLLSKTNNSLSANTQLRETNNTLLANTPLNKIDSTLSRNTHLGDDNDNNDIFQLHHSINNNRSYNQNKNKIDVRITNSSNEMQLLNTFNNDINNLNKKHILTIISNINQLLENNKNHSLLINFFKFDKKYIKY
ncbi:hypothetical protein PIROE2DRAFT_56881 [Piromyces sp. E2]|nr:hypothetical protein PIROE2DRAFT_56881 [Piromyces sp. E2]|eukprot:OUM70192.1 hypothetical protein PIROE2DRAFT_56881 [Piromyces sp. E2]